MAKKKKTKILKKVAKKTNASAKPVKKIAATKSVKPKPATAKPKTPSSVDGILKKYSKQRTTLDTQVVSMRKKIEDLEKKVNDSLAQIDKLIVSETTTKKTISELDTRRDAEVSALLSKLGVKFSEAPPEAPKPTANQSSDSKPKSAKPNATDDDKSEAEKPKVTFATAGAHSGKDDQSN